MIETAGGTIEWLLWGPNPEEELAKRVSELSAETRTQLQCHIAEIMAQAMEGTADDEDVDKTTFEARLGGTRRMQQLCHISDLLEGDVPFY